MRLAIRSMMRADANDVVGWRYDPPYDAYDPPPELAPVLVDPANGYFAVEDDTARLVGFCCFGRNARIDGGDDDPRVIDVGVGLRPELTGRGHGRDLVGAVVGFARQRFAPAVLRAAIADQNRRSLRVFERSGFEVTRRVDRAGGGAGFWVLECLLGP